MLLFSIQMRINSRVDIIQWAEAKENKIQDTMSIKLQRRKCEDTQMLTYNSRVLQLYKTVI